MENILYFIPNNYFYLILVILFSGFIRGFLGFASGLITIPILSFLYSPIFAIVFNIVIEVPTTIYLSYVGAKTCKFREISPMFFSMLITIPIGTIFLISIDEEVEKINILQNKNKIIFFIINYLILIVPSIL